MKRHGPKLPRAQQAEELDEAYERGRGHDAPAEGGRAQEQGGGEGGEHDRRGGEASPQVGKDPGARRPRVTSAVKRA